MVVLDAAALIAVMKNEPAANTVGDLLHGSTVMSSVNYCEVIDHLLRLVRVDQDWIDLHLAPVMHTSLQVVAPDAQLAEEAAQVQAVNYHSRDCPISLADSFSIATAISVNAPLATSDPAIIGVLAEMDHQAIALPNSRGEFPQ